MSETPKPPREMIFSDENIKYLLLNIITHDVIHDYGNVEKRWSANQQIVKQFWADNYTFSLPTTGGSNEHNETLFRSQSFGNPRNRKRDSNVHISKDDLNISKKRKSYSSQSFNKSKELTRRAFEKLSKKEQTEILLNKMIQNRKRVNNYVGNSDISHKKSRVAGPDNGVEADVKIDHDVSQQYNYTTALSEMKEHVNTHIIFILFDKILKTHTEIIKVMNDPFYWKLLFHSSSTDQLLNDTVEDLINKFKGDYYEESKQEHFSDKEDFVERLCKFLSQKEIVIDTIIENVVAEHIFNDGMQTGGKKDIVLSVDESKALIEDITSLENENSSNLDMLQERYDEYYSENSRPKQKIQEEYEELRKSVLDPFHRAFKDKGQTKKAGGIYGDTKTIPVLRARFVRRNLGIKESFKQHIKESLLEYNAIVKEAEDEAAKQQRQKEKDEIAAMSGDLTSADKLVRSEFIKFIARMGLFLTGVIKPQPEDTAIIDDSLNNLSPNSALRRQINILLYITEYKRIEGWDKIRTQNLDDKLIEFFENEYFPKREDNFNYRCQNIGKYVVNNASPLPDYFRERTFCPYSSILDGMLLCTWKTAQGSLERGNMDFKLKDESDEYSYQGKMTIDDVTKVTLNIDVKTPLIQMAKEKQVSVNGSDLEAHYVLKNTLLKIIQFILKDPSSSLLTGNIFDNLFDYFVNGINKGDATIKGELADIYTEILFKGTGDLFQEINCVCKFGGYTGVNFYSDVPSFNASGNTPRFFAANDRPSGTRFIFMLKNGRPEDINRNAFGGYYSIEDQYLHKRDDVTNVCDVIAGGGKSRKPNKITRKHNRRRKNRVTR
jgi:hypothetical protein